MDRPAEDVATEAIGAEQVEWFAHLDRADQVPVEIKQPPKPIGFALDEEAEGDDDGRIGHVIAAERDRVNLHRITVDVERMKLPGRVVAGELDLLRRRIGVAGIVGLR